MVGEATDGEAALLAARRTEADVVLMDVRMPGLGGLEATRRLKRAVDGPTVVLLTLGACEHLRGPAGDVGADGLLSKSEIEERLPPMLDEIRRARRRIDLETYIYSRGDISDRFTDALEAAARRGAGRCSSRYRRPRTGRRSTRTISRSGWSRRCLTMPSWSMKA